MSRENLTVIECHNSTKHDGAVAVFHKGEVYALAAERVDRVKRSCDIEHAYRHLVEQLSIDVTANDVHDHFSSAYIPYQELHHHLAHAASAFLPSPYEEAAVLIMDGDGPYRDGQRASTSLWIGKGNELTLLDIIAMPGVCYQSLGHFYSACSYYLGFGFFDSSHTMSLAPYGDPDVHRDFMHSILRPEPDGLFRTDRDFIHYVTHQRFGGAMGWHEDPATVALFLQRYEHELGPLRTADTITLEQRHMDIAAAAQTQLELVIRHVLQRLHSQTGLEKLCLAGGVALNCVANQRAIRSSPFSEVFIQPASGDDGQALGKLLYRIHREFGISRQPQKHSYLGPSYSHDSVSRILASQPSLAAEPLPEAALLDRCAQLLAEGNVIGWFQGRSEFGPRALGHRSVLADPRSPETKERVSRRFKKREWYRPFAPSVLARHASEYFDIDGPSPFMLRVAKAHAHVLEVIPAVIHVDGTARIQTVDQNNGIYHDLISAFARRTGVPILLNTSFNLPGEPIVETPQDAIDAFLRTQLDYLVIDRWLVQRKAGADSA